MNAIDELRVYIKLKHPDPETDVRGFIDSLPDDFVESYFYTSKDYTTEEKRRKAKNYFYWRSATNPAVLLPMLEEYYATNQQ